MSIDIDSIQSGRKSKKKLKEVSESLPRKNGVRVIFLDKRKTKKITLTPYPLTNGNLNLGQKFLKAGIQVAGAGVSLGVGYAVAQSTFFTAHGALYFGTSMAVLTAGGVTKFQDYLYEKLELQ